MKLFFSYPFILLGISVILFGSTQSVFPEGIMFSALGTFLVSIGAWCFIECNQHDNNN